jgi:hypothetical protein
VLVRDADAPPEDNEPLPDFTPGPRHGELVTRSAVGAVDADFSAGTEHIATVVPFLFESRCALYRGCFVESDPYTLSCDSVDCNPPVLLELAQTGYGETVRVSAIWRDGEDNSYPGDAADGSDGIYGYVDDLEDPVGVIAADALRPVFNLPNYEPGEYTFGIQGNCGEPFGRSTILEQAFTILGETPHPNPIEGEIECEYDAEAGALTAAWTNADPSCFIDVFVYAPPAEPDGEEQVTNLGSIPGGEETITVTGVESEEWRVALQFFTRDENGIAYGSEVLFCGHPAESFIRGPCGAPDQADPQITHAITIFGFLFLGNPPPPCLEACDVDGIDPVNITDGIYLLAFLFSGGPPPAGWIPETAEPTCEEITPEMDCQTPSTACPLE